MSVADHTPGPWIVAGSAKDAEPETPIRWQVWSDEISEEVADRVRTQADARLIAAAPDLLAALRAARADLSNIFEAVMNEEGQTVSSLQRCINLVGAITARAMEDSRAAIAKATGKGS